MAEFEDTRYCTLQEFKYFEEERKDPTEIKENELYIAMFALEKSVYGAYDAVAIPLQVTEIDGNRVSYRTFNERKPVDYVLAFAIGQHKYIDSIDAVITEEEVSLRKGYVRDYHERLDGTSPETDVFADIPTPMDIASNRKPLVAA